MQNYFLSPQIQIWSWQFNSWAQAFITNSKNVTLELVTKERWVVSLKAYCLYKKLNVLKYYEREIDWASVITCIWFNIHSSAQSHIRNKTLVWMSAEESDIFVVLSFHLLRVISVHLLAAS